ncbi:anti-sigma factor RsbA family regulatory protein [Streptomonospora alba]|uniref:anti-sigma factor RsbA family regulatory protein n=1 Tax=Streptomonospora alba TaxID=183763 RepID=UPI00069BCFFA|nr:anti-sigma factor RsbA family regulatory protein [Streptomonospora alba]
MTSRAETAGTGTEETGGFQHRGVFYSSAADLRDRVLPRMRAARRDGDRVVLGVAPETRAALLSGLPAADASHVEPLEAAELYDAPGRTLAALHSRARAEHPRPVLVVGEPPLPSEDPVRLREWHRLDSVLTRALAGTRLRLLCLHDTRTLPERVRRDVRRTHPVLVAEGDEHGSPDYVDPASFSAPDLARPLPAPAGEQRTLEFDADLAALRTAATEAAEKAGVPRKRLGDLVLAVNELAANAVEHGGGAGTLTLGRRPGWLLCDVADRGTGLHDPLLGYHPADPLSPRGYGLWITRQLCDYMEISSGAHGSRIRLHFAT